MTIEQVERFHCRSCGFISEDPDQIEWIRKLGGRCPACNNGKSKAWTYEGKPPYKS